MCTCILIWPHIGSLVEMQVMNGLKPFSYTNGMVPFVYGIERRQAYQWGYTSKGYWRIADSWILARAIVDESLRRAGYSWIGCYYSASALPKG